MINSVVTMLTMSPMRVIKLGAIHMGVCVTNQFQKGCRYESAKLVLSHLYVWSVSFFSWTGNSILSLAKQNIAGRCFADAALMAQDTGGRGENPGPIFVYVCQRRARLVHRIKQNIINKYCSTARSP